MHRPVLRHHFSTSNFPHFARENQARIKYTEQTLFLAGSKIVQSSSCGPAARIFSHHPAGRQHDHPFNEAPPPCIAIQIRAICPLIAFHPHYFLVYQWFSQYNYQVSMALIMLHQKGYRDSGMERTSLAGNARICSFAADDSWSGSYTAADNFRSII